MKIGAFIQSLGRTFMVPVALLAAMGLMLGLGSGLAAESTVKQIPFLGLAPFQIFFNFMSSVGGFAFSYLPVMFAMAIPLGLAKQEKGVAAFSGFVSYVLLNIGINFMLTTLGWLQVDSALMKEAGQKVIMGIHTIDTGVLGAIIIGSITAKLHDRFYTIQFHDAFSFWSGARFVPIISAIVAAIIGLAVPFVWPIFSAGIKGLGFIIEKSGIFAPFIFFTGERFFIPFGLQHILVAFIRFTEMGGTEVVNGESISGALNIFFAQLKAGTDISPDATRFLSGGKMPAFLFGLPAAAFAMYHTAKKENSTMVKGLMLSGIVACIFGGITEPLEFLFLFVSFPLFVFHALMTGLGAMVMALMGVTIGNTDGNLLDLLIFGILPGLKTKWYMLFIIGPIWAAAYYFVFKWAILKYDLKTPGREDNVSRETNEEVSAKTTPTGKVSLKNYTSENYLKALGGKENIVSLDNCITRLRLEVKDGTLVNEKALKDAGAIGFVKGDGKNIQVVIGPQVHILKQAIEKLL